MGGPCLYRPHVAKKGRYDEKVQLASFSHGDHPHFGGHISKKKKKNIDPIGLMIGVVLLVKTTFQKSEVVISNLCCLLGAMIMKP